MSPGVVVLLLQLPEGWQCHRRSQTKADPKPLSFSSSVTFGGALGGQPGFGVTLSSPGSGGRPWCLTGRHHFHDRHFPV